MPKNTGGRRASARSAAFRPGGNSSTNHKPLFDMNVMSLHARKNVTAEKDVAANKVTANNRFIVPTTDLSSNYSAYLTPIKGEMFYEITGNNLYVAETNLSSGWMQVTSTNS
jgi:hypothetical protein